MPHLTILANGTHVWLELGLLHHEHGPAVIRPDGTQEWWLMGKQHRTDGPATVRSDGTQEHWLHGQPRTLVLLLQQLAQELASSGVRWSQQASNQLLSDQILFRFCSDQRPGFLSVSYQQYRPIWSDELTSFELELTDSEFNDKLRQAICAQLAPRHQ